MAQPEMKRVGAIPANETVVIDNLGIPHPETLMVKNRDVIAFQTKPDETKQWLLQFYELNSTTLYPMTIFVPEKGGITYVVVDWDKTSQQAVQYTVDPFPDTLARAEAGPDTGKYTITITSTGG
jgi:hypothetical protein